MASLCSISKETVFQNEINLGNNEFVTLYLLSEEQIQSEVTATVDLFKDSAIIRITSFISYLRIITRANYFISGLSTNLVISVVNNFGEYATFGGWMQFYRDATKETSAEMVCGNANPIRPAGFYPASNGKE